MDSVASSPMTNGHPMINGKKIFIDAKNTKKFQVGFPMGYPWEIDNYLTVWLILTDTKAIIDYYQGKNKISLGGICNPLFIAGEWGGKPYDFIASDPLNNHIAMCYTPRSENYNLKMGILDSIDPPDPEPEHTDKEPKMALLKIGTQQVEIEDSAHAAVSTYIAGLETSLATSKQKSEQFEALYDSKDQELKASKEAGENVSYKKFTAFANLMQAAKKDLPKKLFDSIDFEKDFKPVSVKTMILANKYPALAEKYKNQTEGYINTAFEAYMDFSSQNPEQAPDKDFGKPLLDSSDDEDDDTQSAGSKAFLNQMQKSQDLWKNK
jgi:hypothetical protein